MAGAVPNIRPISDLKNTSEISDLCHEAREPIFITKNGHADLVIMSAETYERKMYMTDVYQKLAEGLAEIDAGAEGISHADLMRQMREKLHGNK